jgi:putative intracellular protease/amidase
MTTKGKVLVLVSSGHGLPLKDGKVYTGAGYYLNELTVPVRALMKEGYEITFANPKGKHAANGCQFSDSPVLRWGRG